MAWTKVIEIFCFAPLYVRAKKEIFGSILTDMLIFETETYRTTNMGKLAPLIFINIKNLERTEKKKEIISDLLSTSLPDLDSNQGPSD